MTDLRDEIPPDPPPPLPPRLRCEGGQLIKPNGKPIFLRGVSLGSFPHDEPEDAVPIKALGANCVRIMFRWHGMWGQKPSDIAYTDSRDNLGYALLKRANVQKYLAMCQAASDAGLWVVAGIDSQCGQSGTQDAEMVAYCDPYGLWGSAGRNFYTDVSLRRMYTQLVLPTLCTALRRIERVAMIEPHPEPGGDRDSSWNDVIAQVQQECIDAVRSVDTDTPIMLGPRSYDVLKVAEGQAYFKDRTDIVWTGNTLNQWVVNPDKWDAAMDSLKRLRDETGCPVFQNQLGRRSEHDRSCDLWRAAVDDSRSQDIGYAVWVWKQHTSQDTGYGLNYPQDQTDAVWVAKTEEQAILAEDWGGTPPVKLGRVADHEGGE
jgi:hypothetical protein